QRADGKAGDVDDLAPFQLQLAVGKVALVGSLHGHEAEHAADDPEATATCEGAHRRNDQPGLSLLFELGIGRTACRTERRATRVGSAIGRSGWTVASGWRARRVTRRTVATGTAGRTITTGTAGRTITTGT